MGLAVFFLKKYKIMESIGMNFCKEVADFIFFFFLKKKKHNKALILQRL